MLWLPDPLFCSGDARFSWCVWAERTIWCAGFWIGFHCGEFQPIRNQLSGTFGRSSKPEQSVFQIQHPQVGLSTLLRFLNCSWCVFKLSDVDDKTNHFFSIVVILSAVCLRRWSSPVTHQPIRVYKALLPLLCWLPLLVAEWSPPPPPLSVYVQKLQFFKLFFKSQTWMKLVSLIFVFCSQNGFGEMRTSSTQDGTCDPHYTVNLLSTSLQYNNLYATRNYILHIFV